MGIAGVGTCHGNQENIYHRSTSAGKTEAAKKNYTREEMFQMISERKQEIYEKVKNNETEASFQIGSQSFTIKEWEKLLKQFDSAEEKIKEQMKEEQAKRQKETQTKVSVKTTPGVMSEGSADIAKTAGIITSGGKLVADGLETEENNISVMDSLVTESTVCTYPASDGQETDQMYITWYTEEGIFCRKAGQTEGYFWMIAFEDTSQYDKVMRFLNELETDTDYQFAAREDFWRNFLKE